MGGPGIQPDNGNKPDEKKGIGRVPETLLKAALAGLLVLLPGLLGYATGNLWLFPSLGPTIVLQITLPHHRRSWLYSVVVGHIAGIFCGYSIAMASGAAYVPSAFTSGHLGFLHVVASCTAVTLLILVLTPLKAMHPPAASTALLIALGGFRATWHDFIVVLVGIVIIATAGEVIRRILVSMEEHGYVHRHEGDPERASGKNSG